MSNERGRDKISLTLFLLDLDGWFIVNELKIILNFNKVLCKYVLKLDTYGNIVFLEGNFITSTTLLGLCVSVTFNKNDSIEDLNYMTKKILNLKVFNDNLSDKPWKMNLKEKGYGITVLKEKRLISGFDDDWRPQFEDAMDSRSGHKFYKMFIKMLKQSHDPKLIKGTSFRKPVRVNVINDGPAIFVLNSPSILKRSPREKFIAAYGLKYFVD